MTDTDDRHGKPDPTPDQKVDPNPDRKLYPTQTPMTNTDDSCEEVRSGRYRSSSGGLVPHDLWEQEGSDMLPGGQGIAVSPASSLDSAYLLVLAIKMACNNLR